MVARSSLYFFEHSNQLQLLTHQNGQTYSSNRLKQHYDIDALGKLVQQPDLYLRAELASKHQLFLVERQQHGPWQFFVFDALDQGESNWRQFVTTMKTMHGINLRLSQITDLDQLIKAAIIEAQQHLFIDRLGVLIIDGQEMCGTWGTNEDGELEDCSSFRKSIPDVPWVAETLANREHVACWDNVDLVFKGRVVGKGWNAMAGLWNGDQCIGWIACDNLIKKRPMQPWLLEIIAHFGQMLGHLIARREHTQQLQQLNNELEARVIERTEELKLQLELLEKTQQELIQQEKLASLGGLVAGVAHEINTPIGVAVTAASHLEMDCHAQQQAFNQQLLTKSALANFLQQSQDTSKMILLNLERANQLIRSFKQLAVEQLQDDVAQVKLLPLLNNLAFSFQHELRPRQIELNINCPDDLTLIGVAGQYNQIFTNLINNSLKHAFSNKTSGNIYIKIDTDSTWLHIAYHDDGSGVAPENLTRIFNPFYTTKRNDGGTGLGLNIVANLIHSLQGTIKAESLAPGLGFKISIPLTVEEAQTAKPTTLAG